MITLSIMLANIMQGLDNTILNVALPHPFGSILFGLRVAEIDQNPMSHVFSNVTVELTDRLGNCPVVRRNHNAQILRI
jgi:hypothetical protein